MKYRKQLGIIALAALTFGALYNQPIYRRYTLETNAVNNPVKIVFLSDLHNSIYGDEQDKLIQMITDETPDLILFGGDIADERSDILGTRLLLEGIHDLAPMYLVSGNHEQWMDDTEGVFDLYRSYGVRVLLNQQTTLQIGDDIITLAGLLDPDANLGQSAKENLIEALSDVEGGGPIGAMEGYRILLSHRPEHMPLYANYAFDLVLSGHAHGGQGRIPFILNGLYAPNQGFFPKYAGGLYNLTEKTTAIVSRGLSHKKLPRIFNPPEVVIIHLIPIDEDLS